MSIIHRTRKLIVIEGTDKENQTKLLEEKLSSKVRGGIFIRSFPRYNKPTGEEIKEYENGGSKISIRHAAQLYTFDRYFSRQNIIHNLEGGSILCNGYVESTMIHLGRKLPDIEERTEFIEWLERREYGRYRMPRPDAVILLNKSHEVDNFHIELAEKYNWTQIECTPKESINEELLDKVKKILKIP